MPERPIAGPKPVVAPSGDQIVAGYMGSVLMGFAAWRAFDEPSGHHSKVKDDWGYTPRAMRALTIGSYVGGTLGVWLRGRHNGSVGSFLATALGVALPTVPMAMIHDDPVLPFKLIALWAPVQGLMGYAGYKISGPRLAVDSTGVTILAEKERPSTPRRGDDVILQDEMARATSRTVYDVISQLRPHWFTAARLRSSIAGEAAGESGVLMVYVDGVRTGTIDALHQMLTTGAVYIRYYNARDATNTFGTGHPAGAVEVSYSK